MAAPEDTALAPTTAAGPVPSPSDPVLDAFARLSTNQQRYLAYLSSSDSYLDALRKCGLAFSTLRTWRCRYPHFRLAEKTLLTEAANYGHYLARHLARARAPALMFEAIYIALNPATTDRSLLAKIRSLETVLRAAGVLTPEVVPGVGLEVEKVDVVALRIWARRGTEQPQPPQIDGDLALGNAQRDIPQQGSDNAPDS